MTNRIENTMSNLGGFTQEKLDSLWAANPPDPAVKKKFDDQSEQVMQVLTSTGNGDIWFRRKPGGLWEIVPEGAGSSAYI